jgi:hypothetical protein
MRPGKNLITGLQNIFAFCLFSSLSMAVSTHPDVDSKLSGTAFLMGWFFLFTSPIAFFEGLFHNRTAEDIIQNYKEIYEAKYEGCD